MIAGNPATKAVPSAPEVVFRKSRRWEGEGEGESFCIPSLITLWWGGRWGGRGRRLLVGHSCWVNEEPRPRCRLLLARPPCPCRDPNRNNLFLSSSRAQWRMWN